LGRLCDVAWIEQIQTGKAPFPRPLRVAQLLVTTQSIVLRLGGFVCVSVLVASCSLVLPNDGLSGGAGAAGAAGVAGSGGSSTLPSPNLLDCGEPVNAGELRCRALDTLSPGSIGAGPAFQWTDLNGNPRNQVVGGFIEPGRLVLAVKAPSESAVGGLVAVDLATGERTLLSGELSLMNGGMLSQGVGWGFQGITNAIGTPSTIQVHTMAWGFDGHIIDVDRATGDRANALPLGTECEQVLPTDFFVLDLQRPALGPDAAVYLLGQQLGQQRQGVVRQVGQSCEVIVELRSGDVGYDPNFLSWHDGKLWGVDRMGKELFSIDLYSAAIDRISFDEGLTPDVPLGIDHLAVRDGRVYTVGSGDLLGHRIVEVDAATGARVAHVANRGPLQTVPYPTAGPRVWMHPSLAALIIAFNGAVVLFDPATDQANTLSY
jgi:hypothetical protein